MEEDKKNALKGKTKAVTKVILKPVIIIAIIAAFVIALLAGFLKIILEIKSENNPNNSKNGPGAISRYTEDTKIKEDGEIALDKTAQELWDELEKNRNDILDYLDTPEELKKLVDAELITQYLDTRPGKGDEGYKKGQWKKDIEKPIKWDDVNNDINSKDVYGVIKLKRSLSDNSKITMTYVSPKKFQQYIDNYNKTGSEADKKLALSHFTMEKTSSSSSADDAKTISEGESIEIPKGLGSVKTYMGWQLITDVTSKQYKLREKAGMNFDSEGFGVINGRYVIACTTTFGTVGDYVDFYQEDGTIIPCIIGDIKNQNDEGCNKWGHLDGKCIVEFIVDVDSWYSNGQGSHDNPGTANCHPEWNKDITKAVNGGNYDDNPSFGTDEIEEKLNDEEDEKDSDEENSNKKDEDKKDKKDKKDKNSGTGFWWPIGSSETTEEDGKTFASGDPALGLNNVSAVGRNGAGKWGGGAGDHLHSDNIGLDVHSAGVSNVYNVIAQADGTVTAVGDGIPEGGNGYGGMGNHVIVNYGDITVRYMHLYAGSIKVNVGDKVTYGQVLGKIGHNGDSTGAHSHTDYQDNATGAFLDPVDVVDPNNPRSGGGRRRSTTTNDSNNYVAKIATFTETQDTMTTTVEGDTTYINETEEDRENYNKFSYIMTTETLNYKEYVSKFTMPFDYLWIMLIYGQEKDFVMELADLVQNSEFEITVHDNLVTNTNIETKKYTKKTKIKTTATVSVYETDSESRTTKITDYLEEETGEFSATYTKVHTVTKKTNTTEVALTKADAWCVTYTQEFKYEKRSGEPNVGPENSLGGGEEDTIFKTDDPLSAKNKFLERAKSRYPGSKYSFEVSGLTSKYTYSIENATVQTTNIVDTSKYISSPAETKEKTDPDSKEPNFIKLLIDHYDARTNIFSVENWVYDALSKNTRTKDMVDLTKYLFYVLTGRDKGITEFDFKIFSLKDVDNNGGKKNPKATKQGWTQKGNLSCPIYSQYNPDWTLYPYNYRSGGTIGSGGCGACAVAMAASGFTQTDITPVDMVDVCNSGGFDTVNGGMYLLLDYIKDKYNISWKYINVNKNEIDQELANGNVLIFTTGSNGIYNGDGHWMMNYGKDGDDYYVAESANYYEADRGYTYSQVFGSARAIFSLGKN